MSQRPTGAEWELLVLPGSWPGLSSTARSSRDQALVRCTVLSVGRGFLEEVGGYRKEAPPDLIRSGKTL